MNFLKREKQDSMMLVEQNAGLAFNVTEQVYVLEAGRIRLKGETKELMNN